MSQGLVDSDVTRHERPPEFAPPVWTVVCGPRARPWTATHDADGARAVDVQVDGGHGDQREDHAHGKILAVPRCLKWRLTSRDDPVNRRDQVAEPVHLD
eukprot:2486862-Pyramimonas_sp.AAC.1